MRWCGNEAGHTRTSEWSVVAASLRDQEGIAAASQQEDSDEFRQRFTSKEEDLGSREALAYVPDLVWYPAEVDTSIRPGWFYHEAEDDKVRPLELLKRIYIGSVGGNACLLLNIPPNREGRFADPDVARLREIGDWRREAFADDLLAVARFTASSEAPGYELTQLAAARAQAEPLAYDDPLYAWRNAEDDASPTLSAALERPIRPRYLVIQEEIRRSQRVEAFVLSAQVDGRWQEVCRGTTVGHRRIVDLGEAVEASDWRLEIPSSRDGVYLRRFSLY